MFNLGPDFLYLSDYFLSNSRYRNLKTRAFLRHALTYKILDADNEAFAHCKKMLYYTTSLVFSFLS